MPPKVFIDGHVGTTGLRIYEMLGARSDLELLSVDEAGRKDEALRRALHAEADLSVLCLPDDAAREIVAHIPEDTRVIDASTAHRIAPGWVFGLPELAPEQRGAIAAARLVSNPGCYPAAVITAVRPLVEAGLLPASAPLGVHALSGYSGGGRPLIERWQEPAAGLLSLPHEAPYAMDRIHKHIDEMTRHAGLEHPPHFIPAVGPFRCGLRVEISLHAALLASGATGKAIWEALDSRYRNERFVRVAPLREPLDSDEHSFDPQAFNGTNTLEIAVVPNPHGHVLLVVRLDNLGKGASGNAVQCMNLMLGLPEATGLSG
jgi:N-acetyl-gamma-glutamyl-phosphate reductase